MVGAGAMRRSPRARSPPPISKYLARLKPGARGPLITVVTGVKLGSGQKKESGTGAPLTLPLCTWWEVNGCHREQRIVAIAYQVEGRNASLLVAHAASTTNTPHGRLAWQAGGQSYALASSAAGSAEAACLICHNSL